MKKIFGYAACLLSGMLMFSACQNDTFENIPAEEESNMVYFGMNLPEVEDIIVTRAEASPIEKEIHTVHILAFDSDGNCFHNEEVYNDSEGSYSPTSILAIPKASGEKYKNCTIYAITNVGTNEGVATGSYDFTKVTNLNELKATYGYRLLQGSSSGDLTKRTCIPMTGSITVDMTQSTSINKPHKIELERVLARVSFSVSVTNPDLEFYFNNWTVGSLPRYSYVIPQDNDMTSKPESVEYAPYFPSNKTEENLTTYGVNKWITTETSTYGFYMYENRRGKRLDDPNPDNLYGSDYANEIKNKTDVTGNDPKFKTLYAPANASFIILTGVIRDKNTQNVNSFAYKIALGADNATDYNILRNHNYVYNIKINGLKYDDITVEAFDSRVHKAYALQISAPYSQQMDAHYDKRYLDILASPGDLELQFYPTQTDAEAGINAIENKDWIVLSEMDTYNIDIDKAESTSKKYTFNNVEHKKYFIYTQENLTKEARSVVLRVKHTPKPESSEVVKDPVYRYYTYTQAGVIEVDGMYVESYEEYGMELNPSGKMEAVQGLQWGWGLVKSGNTVTKAYDFTGTTNTTDGANNTTTIINTPGDAFAGVDINSLYNNYAARYCYNKNKRDVHGNIVEYKWYLPAVNQLIPLTKQITGTKQNGWTPTTMKDKEYWSSSVPTDSEVNTKPGWANWFPTIWKWFVGNKFNPGSDYEFRNVARAVKNGQENKVTIYYKDVVGWFEYPAEAFPMRKTGNSVRAVRLPN